MEKFLTIEDLEDISAYELKIIMLFHIQKGMKIKDEDAEDNQVFSLSKVTYGKIFKNPNVYYTAIKALTDKGIISKVDGKQSLYRMNPLFVSNLTYQQSVDMGIKKDHRDKFK